MNLGDLIEMSHHYGCDEDYVLCGGGNTSFKDNGVMYVKGSGASLSDIKQEDFVAMDLKALRALVLRQFPTDLSDGERETAALLDMMAAKLPGEESKRPSVEAVLHAIFPYKFVLHVHPALVNGLTCSTNGKKVCNELFYNNAVWIDLTEPGLILAQLCNQTFDSYRDSFGQYPQIVFLENHGIFVAADSVLEIDSLISDVMNKLRGVLRDVPDFEQYPFDRTLACKLAPALRMLYSPDGMATAIFSTNNQLMHFVRDELSFVPISRPFTPDHIVYCADEPLFIRHDANIAAAFSAYFERKGFMPKIVAVQGLGFFALGSNQKAANSAKALFLDTVKIAVYAASFGGVKPLSNSFADFILNWEVERYRSKVSLSNSAAGHISCDGGQRLLGKIAIVTGGAQGFGKGIAEAMAAQGAYLCIADLNLAGAEQCASHLNEQFGPNTATFVAVDVSDELAVERMVQDTVLCFGGLDILVSNAGVLIAGGLSEMTKEKFDFVTKVNYSGYFLCAKYAAEPMKVQHEFAPLYLMDIIEINSKSGLEGSNKNFAYAGSKFGGIGLTQSFAMELVEYGIKVNAICPGNLLDGPLWSDPEKGLFRQYLDSGKVSGAKTIDDVRRFYEAKVPLKRGCTTEDVARAIFYVVEQKYETGQAIPVTGGQIMLN